MRERVRTAMSISAAAVALGLLLSGCGSDSDGEAKSGDNIDGAEGPKKEKPASPSADPKAPKMPLPGDLKLAFDWERSSDPDRAAVLDATRGFLRAITYGIVKQDPNEGSYKYFSLPAATGVSDGTAQKYAKAQIKLRIDKGDTQTGVDRYFRSEIAPGATGTSMRVSFCNSTEELFSKDVKTKKVTKTKPSLDDYYFYKVDLKKLDKAADSWKVDRVYVQERVAKCQG